MRSTRHQITSILVMAIFFLAATQTWASSFSYTREASPKSITVGDVVDVHLTVRYSDDTHATPDAIAWKDIFVAQDPQATRTTSGNTITETWHYRVSVFEPGKHNIPATTVRQTLANEAVVIHKLPGIPLNVVSILPATASAVGALKPLLRPSLTLWPWLLGLLALGGLLWWIWRTRQKRHMDKLPQTIPTLSPKEEALAAIQTLLTSGAIDNGQYKDACMAMTDILKRFLSRHYHQKMQEMTSTEVASTLRATTIAKPVLQNIRNLLRDCDQIKFANGSASTAVCQEQVQNLQDIILTLAPEDNTPQEEASV